MQKKKEEEEEEVQLLWLEKEARYIRVCRFYSYLIYQTHGHNSPCPQELAMSVKLIMNL